MPSDPTVTGAWDIAASRNLGIPFNYIWDKPNSYWRPMGLGDLGSYKDRLTASADSTELKYGSNPNVANSVSINSPETVWDGSTEYVFPPNGGTGLQISSSSNSDNQAYCVLGLDTDFNSQTATGLLNGTGVVNVDGTWSRVFRVFNDGTTSFDGIINIHASGDDSTSYAKILSGNNQTLMAIYTIPANTTGYLIQYAASALNTSSSSTIGYSLHFKTREFGKVPRVKEVTSISTENSHVQELEAPITLEPKTDVYVDIVNANGSNGTVNADFSIALHSS